MTPVLLIKFSLLVHGLKIVRWLFCNKRLVHIDWSRRRVQSFRRNAMFPSFVFKRFHRITFYTALLCEILCTHDDYYRSCNFLRCIFFVLWQTLFNTMSFINFQSITFFQTFPTCTSHILAIQISDILSPLSVTFFVNPQTQKCIT